MNVHNNLQGLQQLLASQEVARTSSEKTAGPVSGSSGDEATLSSAASAAAQTAPDSDVRMEKVAQVQKALAEGTYSVPSSDVANRMMDAMLGSMSDAELTSALAVLKDAIAALARADAPRLERLAAEAGEAVVPAEEEKAARAQYASLAVLLALTRRNLRLLRGERGGMYDGR